MTVRHGRQFLSIPGPTTVPDEILAAMHRPAVDIYGGELIGITDSCLADLRRVFRTRGRTYIYVGNGHGAWEAALANVLSAGDTVLVLESGRFAAGWGQMAETMGVGIETVSGDQRRAVDPAVLETRLREDRDGRIKAILVVQVDTSSGVANDIAALRRAIDATGHDALLMVDAIASLATMDFEMDQWGVDVAVTCSQKGLMMPPGLGLNAISAKALEAAKSAKLPKSFWDWQSMFAANQVGFFPYTPATNLLYGLREAIQMLEEEGLPNVFARHDRHAQATRQAVQAWGLEVLCENPAEYSSSLTAVMMPEGFEADALLDLLLEKFDMCLGIGLGKVKGKIFRIGHLGDFNDLMLAGTLAGLEMGLSLADIPFSKGGVAAALDFLANTLKEK